MKSTNRKKVPVVRIALAVVSVAVVFLLAACPQSGSGPTKYVLTVQGVNCTTTPSGTVSVDPGVATAISASANVGYTWGTTSGWVVVSGAASIASPGSSGTTVTLNSGDATIRATCP